MGDLCVPFDHPDVTGPGFHSAPTIFEVDHRDWRRTLLDRVMDACEDEALLARYLETGALSDAELHAQIPRAIARGSLVPILACNPLSGVGVEGVLAFLAEFCPTPDLFTQRDASGAPIALDAAAPLLARVVCVRSDAHLGKLCTLRVLSGTLAAGDALRKLAQEDPTFTFEHEVDTHELLVHGLTEQHLAVAVARLARRYGVEVSSHPPRIAYRETVTRRAEGHHRHKKQAGGRGQFGECFVRVRPNPKGMGVTFTDAVVGGAIPRNLIPAVEKGVREAAAKGVLAHSQVVDVDLELYDGKFHDVDSDEASFKIAGARAFVDAFQKA